MRGPVRARCAGPGHAIVAARDVSSPAVISDDLDQAARATLTARQYQVLTAWATHGGTRPAARALGIDKKTVQESIAGSAARLARCPVWAAALNDRRDETGEPTIGPTSIGPRSADGDPDRLRAIPVLGAGSGVIPGTGPGVTAHRVSRSRAGVRDNVPSGAFRGADVLALLEATRTQPLTPPEKLWASEDAWAEHLWGMVAEGAVTVEHAGYLHWLRFPDASRLRALTSSAYGARVSALMSPAAQGGR